MLQGAITKPPMQPKNTQVHWKGWDLPMGPCQFGLVIFLYIFCKSVIFLLLYEFKCLLLLRRIIYDKEHILYMKCSICSKYEENSTFCPISSLSQSK